MGQTESDAQGEKKIKKVCLATVDTAGDCGLSGDRLWEREHDQGYRFVRPDLYAVGYEALTAQEGMAWHALSQFRAMLVVLSAASIVSKRPEDSWRFARFHGSLEFSFLH